MPARARRSLRQYLLPGDWRRLRDGVSTGLCFAGMLLAVSVVDLTRSAETQQVWRAWASTNLDNLRHHPVAAIAVSPFLADGYAWLWIMLSLVGLAAVGRVLGNLRTAILALAVHVLATLVSEGILAARIAAGTVPPQARHVIDVGPSYVTVGALVAAIGYGTWPGRLLSATGFAIVAPYLFVGLRDWGVAEVGHACAVAIGLLLGYLLRKSRGRPLEDVVLNA